MHFPFLFSVQGAPLQSGGVGLRWLHHAHRGVLQKQGRIPGWQREGHTIHRRGGGARAACGRECWSHSERISELECRRTKWGVRLVWEAGAGELACWDGRWECTWMWPSRGAAGPHPCSVAPQVCVGPESAVTCHDRARLRGWSQGVSRRP